MADTAKAAVTLDDGSTRELDIIEVDGQFWIVSDWISMRQGDPQRPRRMFRLGSLAFQQVDKDEAGVEVKVTTPFTDALLRGGPAPAGSGIEVLDAQFKLQKDGSLRHVGFAPPMQKTIQ